MSAPGGDRVRHEGSGRDIRALRAHHDPAGNMTLQNVTCDLFSSIKSSAVDLA